MHKRSEEDYIEDILKAAKRIISCTKGFQYENFIIFTDILPAIYNC